MRGTRTTIAMAVITAAVALTAGGAAPVSAANSLACPTDTRCGRIERPLDPRGIVPGTIRVYWRLYPHTDHTKPAVGTIVTQEGGPGAPSTGTADKYYLPLFAPLRADHDILMVDPRGTGDTAIDCPDLQKTHIRTAELFGACGRLLGARADLYGTRIAAQDMKAVLDHLHIARIDYYGDSYGTFFGQVFAAMYPETLRSIVLDGAFAVIGQSPWSSNAAIVVREGFAAACQRTPACARLPGRSLDRIRKLADAIRAHPFRGTYPDAEGGPQSFDVDAGKIAFLLYGGTQGPIVYRDLDAAARAYFAGDNVPLLRLVAENDRNLEAEPLEAFSYGQYGAVACMDYQQIYDMTAPAGVRHKQRDAALAHQRAAEPGVYAPVTIDDFLHAPIDTSLLDQCLDWPIDHPPYTPGKPIPEGAHFPNVPTLIINGELDALTPPGDGALVTSQFPNATHVIVANSFHVDALGDIDHCAEDIVRRFVVTRDPGDTSCAAKVRPVRLVPFFPLHAADATQAEPSAGNAATARDLAVASAAVQTAGDVIMRWYLGYEHGRGLRGGHWNWSKARTLVRYELSDVKWTGDLAVSGTAVWNQDSGITTAHLTYDDGGRPVQLTATWNDHETVAVARLEGSADGRAIRATMPAP